MTKLLPLLLAALILAVPAVRAEDEAAKKPAKEAAKKPKAEKADKADKKEEPQEDEDIPVDPGTQQKIEAGIQQLQTSLDLDDAQREKMRAIIAKSVHDTQLELTRMRNRLETLKVRTANDIKAILNDKQRAKYDELQARQEQAAAAQARSMAAPSASSPK